MDDLVIVLLRIITVIPVLMLMTLLMGKRQVGELPVLDFVVAITIGSIAGADIADPSIKHAPTIFAIIVLAILQIGVTYTKIGNRFFNNLLTFKPTIVIENGVIIPPNLKKIRYTVENLLSLLREKDVFKLSDVEFAIIEPTGKLSVLKKPSALTVTNKNLKIPTDYQGLSVLLILEGKVLKDNLAKVNLTEEQLRKELSKQKIDDFPAVFLASLETDGSLYIAKSLEAFDTTNLLDNK